MLPHPARARSPPAWPRRPSWRAPDRGGLGPRHVRSEPRGYTCYLRPRGGVRGPLALQQRRTRIPAVAEVRDPAKEAALDPCLPHVAPRLHDVPGEHVVVQVVARVVVRDFDGGIHKDAGSVRAREAVHVDAREDGLGRVAGGTCAELQWELGRVVEAVCALDRRRRQVGHGRLAAEDGRRGVGEPARVKHRDAVPARVDGDRLLGVDGAPLVLASEVRPERTHRLAVLIPQHPRVVKAEPEVVERARLVVRAVERVHEVVQHVRRKQHVIDPYDLRYGHADVVVQRPHRHIPERREPLNALERADRRRQRRRDDRVAHASALQRAAQRLEHRRRPVLRVVLQHRHVDTIRAHVAGERHQRVRVLRQNALGVVQNRRNKVRVIRRTPRRRHGQMRRRPATQRAERHPGCDRNEHGAADERGRSPRAAIQQVAQQHRAREAHHHGVRVQRTRHGKVPAQAQEKHHRDDPNLPARIA